MNIGTAKPDAETLKKAPHRLIDFLDPAIAYSAADFRKDALVEMHEITEAGNIPLLVGGTFLYFRALLQGLAKLPPANPAIRARLDQEAKEKGWHYQHDYLATIDPLAAKRIHPNDAQRIQRAIEVYEITGKALTTLQKESQHDALPWNTLKLALIPNDREKLKIHIKDRFEAMLQQDFITEVKKLHSRKDLHTGLPAIRSVGYRQVWEYLNGEIDFNDMKERVIVATRQLAKRQLTWLRSEEKTELLAMEADDVSSVAIKKINHFLACNAYH